MKLRVKRLVNECGVCIADVMFIVYVVSKYGTKEVGSDER